MNTTISTDTLDFTAILDSDTGRPVSVLYVGDDSPDEDAICAALNARFPGYRYEIKALVGWDATGDEIDGQPESIAHLRESAHEPRIVLHNDPSRPTYVHEMTAEEVELCHRNAVLMDDDIRNALDGAADTDREWLALYAVRHEAAHGTPWCLP